MILTIEEVIPALDECNNEKEKIEFILEYHHTFAFNVEVVFSNFNTIVIHLDKENKDYCIVLESGIPNFEKIFHLILQEEEINHQ